MSRSTTGCLAAGCIPDKQELQRKNRWARQSGKSSAIKHDKAYETSLRRVIFTDLKEFPHRSGSTMDTCSLCKECTPRPPKEMTKKTLKRHLCRKRSLLRTGQEPICLLFDSAITGKK